MGLYKLSFQFLTIFAAPLGNCIDIFLQKDPSLIQELVTSLLKFWPASYSQVDKHLLFIDIVERTLVHVPKMDLSLQESIFGRCAQCLSCNIYSIVERVLSLL